MARARKPMAHDPELPFERPPSDDATPGADDEVEEGKVVDLITGRTVTETEKERVRQRTARALLHEFSILVEDMEPDFRVAVDGKKRKIDIAIFEPGAAHTPENVARVVLCQKEPRLTEKSTYKLRDHAQADKDLALLKDVMVALPNCRYGMWTNALEVFYFRREKTRFDAKFVPVGDWPQADESFSAREVASEARLRRAEDDLLRTSFRRCHNFIHGNEGMPKDAAFWQFLYLIFAKIYDEQRADAGHERRFWAGATEPFTDEGCRAIEARIQELFAATKKQYAGEFREGDQLTLSRRALAFVVSELARYDFGRTSIDVKGLAYQEIVGNNLRGDRGQYFTPRGAIDLTVALLDPKLNERVLDPACGTGGFLRATVSHWFKSIPSDAADPDDTRDLDRRRQRLRDHVNNQLFGADFDPFLARSARLQLTMAANAPGHVYHMDSLSFPQGHLDAAKLAARDIEFGSLDVVMTNPPFGSDIPITDPTLLRSFELAERWEKKKGQEPARNGYESAVAPEVLFIEQCHRWLREGGRMGIVLPNGILGNPGDARIRQWILRHCWVLASVELPVETFIADANVNILTSVLVLKKKPWEVIRAEDMGGQEPYDVFMAVAEKVGVDRRGNKLYRREPDGEESLFEEKIVERVRRGGVWTNVTLHRRVKHLDDDLPRIAEAYRKFRLEHREPGT